VAGARIREATEEDVPLILSLIRELAEYEKLSDEVVATEDGLRDSMFGERRYAEVFIAEHDGAPAGFALFFHNFSTFLGKPGLYLEDLYVKPAFRGAGIGKKLLVRLASLAVGRGCGRLEWWVLDWNEPAIGFYRSVGAEPMDDWTVYRVSGSALEDLASSS
jgi:GNAT superfamily N-acetyltransferase